MTEESRIDEHNLIVDINPSIHHDDHDIIAFTDQNGSLANLDEQQLFGVAFVDIQMPAGWDGLASSLEMGNGKADLLVMDCTTDSNEPTSHVVERFAPIDKLPAGKSPFDDFDVAQLTASLVEQKKLRNMAQQRVSELEELIRARTRDLNNAALKAQQASNAKSQFLANMSHELRTPLTAILGYAETFLKETVDNLTDEQSHAVDTITNSGEHLLRIINEILDLSTIESGEMEIQNGLFSPSALAHDVVSMVQVQADKKRLGIELMISGDVPNQIESDHARVKQVLINLLDNAIKFTHAGQVTLVVRTRRKQDQESLVFQVEDTGIGIDAGSLRTIFAPFAQVDDSMSRRYGGVGLGLTINQRLAKSMDGAIRVRSTLGVGSLFEFELPLNNSTIRRSTVGCSVGPFERQDESVRDCDREAIVGEPANQGETHARDILLAEDDELNRRFIAVILSKGGHQVETADNGAIAYEKAAVAEKEGRPFDVILMDMQMPVMDGYEAARRLRAEGSVTPIIALTAHAMAGDREKCLAAGCSDYATKPIKRETLYDMIEKWTQVCATAVVRRSANCFAPIVADEAYESQRFEDS